MDYSRWAEMQHHQPPNPNPSSADPYARFYDADQSSSYAYYYYSPHQTHSLNSAKPQTLLNHHENPNLSSIDPYSRLYDADQSSSYANYHYNPHQTHNLNLADPQTLLKHHEISSAQYEFGPESGLRPPVIDSYATINSYPTPLTHLGLTQIGALTAAAYHQETGAAVQSWAAKEAIRQFGADPVSYAAARLRPPKGTQPLRAANPNPHGWSKPKMRPAVNGTWKRGTMKTKIVQSAWCEICKIDCNSKDVLDQHKLGKKHKKNLEKLEESKKEASAPVATETPATKDLGRKEFPAADKGKTVGVHQGKNRGASSLELDEDLETKRRKLMQGGAAADAVRMCTICNVVCNSQMVLDYHLAGQKHANMVKKQASADGTENPGPEMVTAA